jgi:hypothetical protein
MAEPQQIAFDAPAFLAEAGLGRSVVRLKPKHTFFSQGGAADSIFYLQMWYCTTESSARYIVIALALNHLKIPQRAKLTSKRRGGRTYCLKYPSPLL